MDPSRVGDFVDLFRVNPADPNPALHRRLGKVTAVSLSAGTCTVQISGSSTAIAGVSYLLGVVPIINDLVWLTEVSGVYVILGIQGPRAFSTYTPAVSYFGGAIQAVGAVSGFYQETARGVMWRWHIKLTTDGTGSTAILVSLPLPYAGVDGDTLGSGRSLSTNLGLTVTYYAGGALMFVMTTAGGYPGGTGAELTAGGCYETTT